MALVQVKTLPDVTVATLTLNSLGESDVEAVWEELSALARQLDGRGLHLDLGAVTFLTSIGLAGLVSLFKQVRAGGGRLSLRNVRPEVYEVFAITRLTSLLDVRPLAPEGSAPVPASA